jgi:RNA polymerase sigma factor (sigma-70 family)
MQQRPDAQLLRDYAENGAESAFTELVHRHTNLVYSAALRQVDSPDIAAETAQKVFVGLARGAQSLLPRLAPEASLAGWLCRSARNLSLKSRRDEFRRQTRERQVMEELIPTPDAAPDWERLRPALDNAMAELSETDYDALVLRFFQNQDFRSVGAAIGVSDDTAQKRVTRALEKLRELLSRRGIGTSAAALAGVLSANAVQAAPAGLATSISAAALAGTAASVSSAITATKIIAMTALQKTLVTAAVAVLAGAVIYEARQAAQFRAENQTLQQQQGPLTNELVRLRAENQRLTNGAARKEDQKTLTQAQMSELLKLRSQAGQARNAVQELTKVKAAPAPQNGSLQSMLMQGIFTNAFAQGRAVAQKSAKTGALARVARMKERLHLTDEQAQAISDVMVRHLEENSQRMLRLMSGAQTPGESQAVLQGPANEEAEIEALLSPEQLAAYPEFQQAEASTAAANRLKAEVATMSARLDLTPEQKAQLQPALSQYDLSHAPSSEEKAVIALAKASGNLAEAIRLQVDFNKRELEDKLKLFEGILTPAQLQAYKQYQLDTIEMPMKVLLPLTTNAIAQ